MTRNIADDDSNADKTTPVPADRIPMIDSETEPDSLKEITYANLAAYLAALSETLTNKTLTTPTIASFANAAHTHLGAAGGGAIPVGAQGYMRNGKLSVTVASNNLTVAVKTLAGSDPSASDPIYVRVGDTERTISAALSVTKNAGTNWFNAGSAELATQEIDYFVFLGYNATDGVVIGFARIPYPNQYSQFSTTSTAETYCAISTITTAASTDYYEVVGRFAATLSAGAGYTWSVPTFTAINLKNYPIRSTRRLTWTPAQTGYSADPTLVARYYLVDRELHWGLNPSATGTSNATTSTVTLPFTPVALSGFTNWSVGRGQDNATECAPAFKITQNSATMDVYKGPGQTAWTNSGTKFYGGQGIYWIA